MLWLNRPRASREMALEVVNDDGDTAAVVFIHTDDKRIEVEVQHMQDKPTLLFVVT